LQSVGEHKAIWNADGLSSGLYFYTLRAGGFTCTAKMVLLK
jgi:hypothetical protein